MKPMILFCMARAALALTASVTAQTISLETAAPVVVKTVPVAGATDVDPGLTEIKVTYSKAMQDGSWSWSTWGEENYPETTGQPKYLRDGRTCVLPVNLQPNKFYALWLNSEKFENFKDTSGRPAVPYLLTFYTGDSAGRPPGHVYGTSKPTREFVRLVVGKDQMTFEGMPITHDQLEGRLAEVPDRAHTVLEVAATADSNAKEFLDVQGLAGQLARQLGFEYLSLVGVHLLGSKGGQPPQAATDRPPDAKDALLNGDQRAVLAWTDRQFRSFFDERTFDGWSEKERVDLETRLMDSLKGPRTREYYQAINTLAALRSTKALPALREIAYDRREKDNRDRWMAIRALGVMGGKSDVPELIHLVYHGNVNTRWWAQISLVRLTGQNFAKDWNAWGKWWNDQIGQPPFKPEIIRWWNGQPEPEKLAESLDESDKKFLNSLNPKAAAAESVPGAVIAQKIRSEVARQINESGATFDDLQVTVAEKRDRATPFTVSYKGLRNFKYTHGGQPDPQWPASASGQFIMEYIGGGQWQGKLGDTQFTVQVGHDDEIDLPFVNDSQVIGEWESVDFVADPSSFNPDKPTWKGKLYLQGLAFRENGKTAQPWWTWTKGVLIHHGDKTASHYEIREIKGRSYLFLEWKSGDVTISVMKPHYYVLVKKALMVSTSAEQKHLMSLVADFFLPNYRDITSRDSLEWGDVSTDEKGDSSIRYKYRAKIWDKDTVTNNQVFTFDPQGQFVSVKDVYADPKERMMRLVEKFFANNFRDITSRETLEWDEVVPAENGNASIRYRYRASIWDKDSVTNDQVFTFDSQDKFVSVKSASPSSFGASPQPPNEVVAHAMDTISQCAEGDPRVEQALTRLRSLPEPQLVAGLVPYLDASKDTVRRSAVYVLWKGGFADITPAVAPLQKLLAHKEDLTRGMAALALGQNHVRKSFEALGKMTKDDPSGYARRCAAYALGLLGDSRAKPVLEAALNDSEALVRNNAKAALQMLTTAKPPQ